MSTNDVPCRVSADLRRYQREQERKALEHEPIPFDATDDAIMHDTLGNDRLAKPVQALLLTLADIKAVMNSFGPACANKTMFFDLVVPQLEALAAACKAQWEDQ